MINPNSFQLVAGVSIAHKIGKESRSQIAFAAYDALSPDEPSQAAQFVKRLLHLPARFAKSDSTVRSQDTYSVSAERQSVPLFE